jgi:hypothetical protein
MEIRAGVRIMLCCVTAFTLFSLSPSQAGADTPAWMEDSMTRLEAELVAEYGEDQRSRVERGLAQVADFWREKDGDAADFEAFVRSNFAGDQEALDTMFQRFESLFEQLDGHMNEITVAFQRQYHLDLGPILPFDRAFAAYDPSAHILDDFFENKLAFTVLLNFPLSTLEQKLTEGKTWTRRQWAEVRLAERFSKRVPADVSLALAKASARAGQYIAEYNIWMHHLLNDDGKRLFPPGMKLLSHWNLRDEIKAQYAAGEEGLERQRMIQRVMERIVTQSIPAVVVNNPHVDWNPYSNQVWPAAVQDSDAPPPEVMEITDQREADTRYEMILGNFHASRKLDAYSPTAPTLIDRRFNENREIPEERVREMFHQVLSSPLMGEVARLIEVRQGRPLEPFDIWYRGFRAESPYSQDDLDRIVRQRFPNPEAYRQDMPELLQKLGFTPERATYLAANIVVEPARGSGHAWGAQMRSAKSRLRTRVGRDGMDYKGFNIAVHEMGHNVEQTLSLKDIDYTLLEGVPNTAFTEALAFVFQARDLELLGLASEDPEAEALKALNDFWATAEIAAVSLVDMAVWHWMYDHAEATPAELREATLRIAKDIWNRYYASIMGTRNVILLGVYSHMINRRLYLPDYPIGHLIAFQVEEQMKKAGSVGPEFERMVAMGRVAPDLWMINATGKPVGPEALLEAAQAALAELQGDPPAPAGAP